ncbi:hypothetical protein [Massilia sp. TS11]|uniref:hypothetical protein n=1 Tax=Massilia sp. TS11 TaxID=2908003 RepID=UPI001EDBF45E|nr:hypothetical protein [Massilia sp. TS11]MCG2584469.1 hypothetical protein [Massilia sp. TS11]
MRTKHITLALATLALSLVAFAGMANTDQFARAAVAEAAGRDALVLQVFGGADAASQQLCQVEQ